MMARSFFRTLMAPLPSVLATVLRDLQPRLRGGGALFPLLDIAHLLERQPDIVEAFEKPRAVGSGNFKRHVGAARPADALGDEIDGERAVAVDADDAPDESVGILP